MAIEKIIVIAFVTIGYCCTFWPSMIFGRIGEWMDENAPEWLWKPLGGCYICACMWIGSVVYWLLYSYEIGYKTYTVDIKEWLLTCIGAMGVNAVISEFTNKPKEIIIDNPATIDDKQQEEVKKNTQEDCHIQEYGDDYLRTNARLFKPCASCGALVPELYNECIGCGKSLIN